jgi:1-phosphatidylinositol-3-phosphate 5-kinase
MRLNSGTCVGLQLLFAFTRRMTSLLLQHNLCKSIRRLRFQFLQNLVMHLRSVERTARASVPSPAFPLKTTRTHGVRVPLGVDRESATFFDVLGERSVYLDLQSPLHPLRIAGTGFEQRLLDGGRKQQRMLRLRDGLHRVEKETSLFVDPVFSVWLKDSQLTCELATGRICGQYQFVDAIPNSSRLLAGQIFCSRCASNLLPGARFGHVGVVRVCNLCLLIMEESYRRTSSLNPSTQAPIDTSRVTISAPLETRIKPPQSQFAASTLFPRPEPLTQIWEDDSSRPLTPADYDADDWQRSPDLRQVSSDSMSKFGVSPPSAPFRKHLAEEDKAPAALRPTLKLATTSVTPTSLSNETARETFKRTLASENEGADSSPSPVDESAVDYRRSETPASPYLPRFRSRYNSRATEFYEGEHAPFYSPITSQDSIGGRPRHFSFSQRPRGDSLDPDVELSSQALHHARRMLRQCLERDGIPSPHLWEDRLVDLLTKVAKHPFPNVRNGDQMDIRRYIRIKKIPGGKPKDSEYVDGVVCTKNVLHKEMHRHLANPRIMLLTFPLEYQRVENQLMSLDPIIKQEREYLRNLVGRIVAQRPHVVLVEKNVSRLALEYLTEANVSVAKNVKPSVISALHRATQADIISSMDKLALEPRLGRCGTFRTQTYVHPLIPSKRKTSMRFEGCSREMGGTILLRGADWDTLKKVKNIMDFMVLVVFSVKLETFFLWDQRVMFLSPKTYFPPSLAGCEGTNGELATTDSCSIPEDETPTKDMVTEVNQKQLSDRISGALKPYLTASISSSPCVTYPPPYPLLRMYEWNLRLSELRRLRDEGEALQILREEQQAALLAASNSSQSGTSITSSESSEVSDTSTPSTVTDAPTSGNVSPKSPRSLLSDHKDLAGPVDSVSKSFSIAEVAGTSAVREAEVKHDAYLKCWDLYLTRNGDSLNPSDHQNIMLLETTHSSVSERPCRGPELRRVEFYGEDDCTLGQYLEDTVNQSARTCPVKGCDSLLLAHYESYVHGRFRVQIVTEQYPCPLPGMKDRLIMWSYCKLCHREPTPYTVVSKETWSYSFAKYLELCFYHEGLVNRNPDCEHNAHRDYVRYFAYRNLAVRIHIDEIRLNDVIVPPLHLAIKTDTRLVLKIAEYDHIRTKNAAYWKLVLCYPSKPFVE